MLSPWVTSGSLRPHGLQRPGSAAHGVLQARTLEYVAMHPPGDVPNPGTEPSSPALQVGSLLTEPPGKLIKAVDGKNT